MGIVFALTVLAFGGFSPLAGVICDRSGNRPVIVTGMFFLGISIPTLALPDSIYLETVAMILVGA
jgi:MFS family permease